MGLEQYQRTYRIFEGENPYILLCPQCMDTLECTDDPAKGYCFGCGVVWDRKDVKQMTRFIGDEDPVEVNHDGDNRDGGFL